MPGFWPGFWALDRRTGGGGGGRGGREIQFYNTFTIRTFVETLQNRRKPCIKNPHV